MGVSNRHIHNDNDGGSGVLCSRDACDGDDDGDGDFGAGSDADNDCDADGDCESAWHIAAASCLRPNKRTASLLEPIFTFHDIWFANPFIDTNDLSREGPQKMIILGLRTKWKTF